MHEPKDVTFSSLFSPLTEKKIFIFIALIGLIVYFNALFNGFVWDDVGYILLNPEIHSFNIFHLFGTNTYNHATFYRPLAAVYFSLFFNIFGQQAFFYHFFQILLHIFNTYIVFYLFKKFFPLGLSFFLSLIFLIHPIQVESVVYISGSLSELYFFFGGWALLVSMKTSLKIRDTGWVSALFLLSLLSKETGIIFILTSLFYQWLFAKKNLFKILIGSSITVAVYSIVRFLLSGVLFQKDTNTFVPIEKLGLYLRLLHIPSIIFYYVKTLTYPQSLAIDQLWIIKAMTVQNFYFPLLVVIFFLIVFVILGINVWKKQKNLFKIYLFFLIFFLLNFGLVLQIFPLDMTVADRWFYSPLTGLLGIIGVGYVSFVSLKLGLKKPFMIVTSIVVILFCLRTIIRNADWADGTTLYTHDTKIESNYDLEGMLGAQFAFASDYKNAIPHLRKSINDFPHDTTLYDLGYAYEQIGDYANAHKYYGLVINENKIVVRDQILKNAYDGMARVLVAHATPPVAKEFLLKAVHLYPTNGSYWAFLAITDYNLHNQLDALSEAEKAKNLLRNDSTQKLYDRILNQQPLNLRTN